MAKKDVIEAEVVDEETKKEESKKEGIFSKIKRKYNDVQLENSIKNQFAKANEEVVFYTGTGIINSQTFIAENHLNDGYILIFGSDKPKLENTLMSFRKSEDVYKIVSYEDATVEIKYEGVSYERPAIKAIISEKATKVNVVKVEDNYFLVD